MSTIVLLFLAGVVLLGFEVIIPGGILGVIGGIAMLGGCVLAFSQHGMGVGLSTTFAAIFLLGLTLWLELVILPRTRFGKKFSVQEKVDSTSQPALAQAAEVVGKAATALTVLAPSGYVLVEGKRYEAFSQSGHVARGGLLRVVALDNFRLIVSTP